MATATATDPLTLLESQIADWRDLRAETSISGTKVRFRIFSQEAAQ